MSKGRNKGFNRANLSSKINNAYKILHALNEIDITDDFWTVSWDSCSFNIKPFLCESVTLLFKKNISSLITNTLCQDESFLLSTTRVTDDDLMVGLGLENACVFSCLMAAEVKNRGLASVTALVLARNKASEIRHILHIVLQDFLHCSNGKNLCIDLSDLKICNTQAFSVYITIYWLLHKSVKLRMLMTSVIRTINFNACLSEFCPKESLHYRYLHGEISKEELFSLYLGDDDLCNSVLLKELYYLTVRDDSETNLSSPKSSLIECETNKKAHNSTLEVLRKSSFEESLFILNAFSNEKFNYITAKACKATIANDILSEGGRYEYNLVKIAELKSTLNSANEAYTKAKSDNLLLRKQIQDLNTKSTELQNELNLLRKSNDTKSLSDKITSLENKCKEQKVTISEKDNSIENIETQLLKTKYILSKKVKLIKSLTSRLIELCGGDKDISATIDTEVLESNTEMSIEEMASELKGYRIGIFGGFNTVNLIQLFESYGLDAVHVVDSTTFPTKELDCALIIATSIQHKVVKRLKSVYSGKIAYVNGSNANNMIRVLYECLCLGVDTNEAR